MTNAFLLGALLAGMTLAPLRDAQAGPRVIEVRNGINKFRLGDQPMMAVRAHRDNFNAHDVDVVSFYAVGKGGAALGVVSVFGPAQGKETERYQVTVGGGADCRLHDFRLVDADGRQPARLVLAERDFGASYADAATVHFTWYALARNTEEVPGRPALYFQAERTADSRKAYCDVNEAFARELGLGNGGADL
ncbi:hypothetical protein [uncultured Massilia sp.]|uniref:hypothetical protein n=1 Tax=uncultured Massilia sp. TaxID=169973 RepID=UPI0025DA9389|nr:hypothetical protein [uncultured Massilia sp.]